MLIIEGREQARSAVTLEVECIAARLVGGDFFRPRTGLARGRARLCIAGDIDRVVDETADVQFLWDNGRFKEYG